jgi:CBS domain-containing protein
MNVGEICTREVYIVRPHEPLLQAVHEMCKRNVGSVIVVEERGRRVVPVGILTDRDVVGALPEKGELLETTTVGECMSGNLLTLGEDESIVDAMARLRRRGVRRAPVIAANGDLVGIVSADDLLGIVAEQLSSLARLVEWQTSNHRAST